MHFHIFLPIFHNFFYSKLCCITQCDGISSIDSLNIAVCRNKRFNQHKVFADFTE
ncbi:MAG: hypothetical protein KDC16_06735 [Saprospiraceae bacterium]|nr:hypothetical protein [Saprospiraceae bacterium]MCB9327409.1 hypothetical protein [Lewinellaceae bacterium]